MGAGMLLLLGAMWSVSYRLEALLEGTPLEAYACYVVFAGALVALGLLRWALSPKLLNLRGKTVLITGGGRGLGLLLAKRFFEKHDCKVVLWDRNEQDLKTATKELEAAGAKVHASKVDVSNRHAVYKAAEEARNKMGPIDILVNNAGIVTGKTLLECPDELMEKTMQVNSIAHFWTLKAFLPSMIERNSGHIVTIASMAGVGGASGLVDYCASKFAAVGLDESLRMELSKLNKTGVHTTCICPFYINTGMFDGVKTRFPFLLPILNPQDVAVDVVRCVETGRTLFMTPPLMKAVPFLKAFLSTRMQDRVAAFLGISAS